MEAIQYEAQNCFILPETFLHGNKTLHIPVMVWLIDYRIDNARNYNIKALASLRKIFDGL